MNSIHTDIISGACFFLALLSLLIVIILALLSLLIVIKSKDPLLLIAGLFAAVLSSSFALITLAWSDSTAKVTPAMIKTIPAPEAKYMLAHCNHADITSVRGFRDCEKKYQQNKVQELMEQKIISALKEQAKNTQ